MCTLNGAKQRYVHSYYMAMQTHVTYRGTATCQALWTDYPISCVTYKKNKSNNTHLLSLCGRPCDVRWLAKKQQTLSGVSNTYHKVSKTTHSLVTSLASRVGI